MLDQRGNVLRKPVMIFRLHVQLIPFARPRNLRSIKIQASALLSLFLKPRSQLL